MIIPHPPLSSSAIFAASLPTSLSSRHDLVDPRLLQLLDLGLEVVDLLPAVERPAVVCAQALDDLVARLFHVLGQRADLLALLELLAEGVDLLADGEAGRAVAVVSVLLAVAAAALGGRSNLFVGGGQGLGLALLQLLELLGDAGVNLLLNELGA